MIALLYRYLPKIEPLRLGMRLLSTFNFDDEAISHRLGKLHALKEHPTKHLLRKYPLSCKISEVIDKCKDMEPKEERDEQVQIAGRIMGKRSFGKLSFFVLLDEGHKIQLYLSKKTIEKEADYQVLMLSCIL